jgi:TolB-like protein
MAAVLHKEPEPLEAPAELVRIVTHCLRKAPAERFQSAVELRSALANVKISPAAEQPAPSIAVLPFANLSADKDNEYFSDGLAEEILNGLTPLPGLRVIARTSAFAFRGREHAIAEIGEKLKVGSVLHGSVRRSGNRIRINVQLINVSDESQLWSERYDRELRDVFDIQDEIAQAIVEKLKVKLGTKAGKPLVKRYTDNLEAHSLYLKGSFYLYRLWSVDDMEKARDYFEQAVALEPGYAPAWVLLTDYHIARSVHAVAHPREELPKGLEAARRAVVADEALAEAQAALAWHEAMLRFDWTGGLERFETAMRLNPASARSHFWHGVTLCGMSRVEESVATMRRAVELDPLATLFHSYLANQYIWAGEYDRAADHGRQALEIEPDYGMALAALGEAYSYLGRQEEGITLLEKARKVLPGDFWPTAFLGGAYVRAGRRAQAEQLLAELEKERQRRYVSAASIAIIASALGDTDRAVKLLDQAVEDRDPNLMHLAPSPYFKSLHPDPRYQDILRRMNLA